MHSRLLTVLLGICTGISIGEVCVYTSEIALTSLILGLAQIGIFLFEKKGRLSDRKNDDEHFVHRHFSLALLSGLFFLSIFVGVVRVQLIEEKNIFICKAVCEVTALISSSPKLQDENQSFTVTPLSTGSSQDILVKTSLYPRYQKGDRVLLTGTIRETKHAYQHGEEKYFDYATYLRIHGIGSEIVYPKVQLITESSSHGVTSFLEVIREKSVSTISTYVSEPSASLASGMLFGVASMSKELITTFRVAGLSHIVVVSGFNIAILVSMTLMILIFLPLFFRIIISILIVILFVIMVGGEASIIRASCMSFLGLGALALGRGYVARQALLLSLLAIVMYQPEHLLYDASLHLSFLATAGIVYMSDGIKNSLQSITSRTYKEIITTTFAAYIVTLPYSMYAFGSASLYALMTNIIVLPLVPMTMLFTFLAVASSLFSATLATIFGYVVTLLCGWIITVARFVEGLPFASLSMVIRLQTMFILYIVITTIFIFLCRKKKNETSGTKITSPLSDIISY